MSAGFSQISDAIRIGRLHESLSLSWWNKENRVLILPILPAIYFIIGMGHQGLGYLACAKPQNRIPGQIYLTLGTVRIIKSVPVSRFLRLLSSGESLVPAGEHYRHAFIVTFLDSTLAVP